MSERSVEVSKFLALVLRHDPGSVGVSLDAQGWARIEVLLAASAERGLAITREELEQVVAENDKQRFAIDRDTDRVRAVQGHSVAVDLKLEPIEPPEVLYHGTALRTVPVILEKGLLPMARQHVQLSDNARLAEAIGHRRGTPAVLVVESEKMHWEGHHFFLSENGVWLTAAVPPQYLRVKERGRP